MKVCGLDLATHIGLVFLDSDNPENNVCKAIEVHQKGFGRLQSIAIEFEKIITLWKPDLVVIEGYAYCINIRSFITLVEIGTIIRVVLHRNSIPWIDVSPTTLKKFVTGSGGRGSDKSAMARSSKEKWGFINHNHDIIDAHGLAQMGLMGSEELQKFLSKPLKTKTKRKVKNGI